MTQMSAVMWIKAELALVEASEKLRLQTGFCGLDTLRRYGNAFPGPWWTTKSY
jgi:hypothetical protein